jgi:integrase/recombinase XerD
MASAAFQLRLFDDQQPASFPSQPDRRRALTVRDVVNMYLPHDANKTKSREAHAERRRKLLLFCAWQLEPFGPEYGDRLVTDCIAGDLEDWILLHPEWKSGATKNRVTSAIKCAFSWASRGRRIASNPFAGVGFRRGKGGRDLTRHELASLLRAAGRDLRRVIVFLLLTGMRPKELRELLWDQVDLAGKVIVQREHKTEATLRDYRPRKVYLPAAAVRMLRRLKARQWSFQEFVFTDDQGRPWRKDDLCKRIRLLRRRVGLAEDVKLYGCRHFFGTRAVTRGENLATVQELMGHADIRTTTLYVHLSSKDDHLAAAVERVAGH